MSYKLVKVPISTIKPGDTVLHEGVMQTVCRNNIGFDSLFGTSLWGDSYKAGWDPVTLVVFDAEVNRRKKQHG